MATSFISLVGGKANNTRGETCEYTMVNVHM